MNCTLSLEVFFMYKQAEAVKNARVDMRIPQALKEIWQHAAAMRGNNLSDYIINAVSDSAMRDVERQHVIHMTVRDQTALLDDLNTPAREPNERMKKAAADYKKAIEEGKLVVRN
jgi:uncharacterized protein (DUF1778 family)